MSADAKLGTSSTHESAEMSQTGQRVANNASGVPFAQCVPALSPQLLEKLAAANFTRMTPVQAATLPQLLTHKDVCVEACTGSGKTLAFLIPIVELIRRSELLGSSKGVAGLVISPTRELSVQTHKVFQRICSNIPCYLQTGGVTVEDFMNTKSLSGSHETCVLIATPGRLWDLIQRGSLVFRNLEILVLDEADVLLDMGFQDTITSILAHLPKQRRTGLFSATQSAGVVELIRAGLRNPVTIKVRVKDGGNRSQKTPLLLDNYFFVARCDAKLAYTLTFIRQLAKAANDDAATSSPNTLQVHHGKVIVFFATCAAVDFFFKATRPQVQPHQGKRSGHTSTTKQTQATNASGLDAGQGTRIFSLHGKMDNKRRIKTLESFRTYEDGLAVLFCTDLAARGLDIPNVDWIIQFDPPLEPDFFVHRVGRTARAGNKGKALVFLSPHEQKYTEFLASRKVPIADFRDTMPEVTEEEFKALNDSLRLRALNDRDVMEKGVRAFVSHARAYREHRCRHIFKVSNLKFGQLARAFAILRLPKMPELKTANVRGFPEEPRAVVDAIPYLNKGREKQRKVQLAKAKKEAATQKAKHKGKPRGRKVVKRKGEVAGDKDEPKRKRKGQHQRMLEEWNSLAKEERLYKKLKRGKISKAEYERLLGEE